MSDVVVGDDERLVGRARAAQRRTSAGTVVALSAHRTAPTIAAQVGLAAREHRAARRARARGSAAAPCTPTAGRAGRRGRSSRSGGVVRFGAGRPPPTTWPRSASGMPDHERTETTGDLAQRGLDLARRHVRARGLDHVAAPAVEVEEAVVVDAEQIAGAVPAVGGEHLVPLAPVVALHQGRARGTTARRPRPARTSSSGVGVDDPRLEPGHRPPERAAPAARAGRVSSALMRHTLPVSVMPSML